MEGAFNDVALTLAPGASEAGGDRAARPPARALRRPRRDPAARSRLSHWYLESEIDSAARRSARIMPLDLPRRRGVPAQRRADARIVSVQREQIAALKALGYCDRERRRALPASGRLAVAAGGRGGRRWRRAPGWARGMTRDVHATSSTSRSCATACRRHRGVAGGRRRALAAAARRARRGAPRRPPAARRGACGPSRRRRYRAQLARAPGAGASCSPQPTRMILRNLQRHPGRAALSIARHRLRRRAAHRRRLHARRDRPCRCSTPVQVAQRYDVMVTFVEPRSARRPTKSRRLPGVLARRAAFASCPSRLRAGHRVAAHVRCSASLPATPAEPDRRRDRRRDRCRRTGSCSPTELAELLDVRPGDDVTVEVLEGRAAGAPCCRSRGLVDDYHGHSAPTWRRRAAPR